MKKRLKYRSSASTLRPFFTFFGGKYRVAKRYPVPRFSQIIEPFAGAAGYSMRYPHLKVVLNDADPTIVGTWDYLIRAREDEIRRLPLYDGTWESVDDLDLPQEARWLIGWWFNKGTVQPSKTPSRWVRDAGENTGENYWGPGIRERIARQVDSIRHWKVVHGSYEALPDVRSTWFVDPPYVVAGKYRYRDIDYEHLSEWCRARRGQVMVCENIGAEWLPFEPFFDIKATAGRARTGVSREVIWLGGLS